MNIYEEQHLQNKLDEITDRVGQLMLDVILVSVKQVSREFQAYGRYRRLQKRSISGQKKSILNNLGRLTPAPELFYPKVCKNPSIKSK
jgi:hypothetical protein